MNSKKFLIGTLVGGISYFFLGYLIYGVLLASFFNSHSLATGSSMKAMSDIVWWALILGNFSTSALLTYVLLKVGKPMSFSSGGGIGAAIGFFVSLSTDMIGFATSIGLDLTARLTDVLVATVMSAIIGGIIGAVLGMGNKKA